MSVFRKPMAASCFLVATMIAGCAAEAAQATTAVPLRLVAQWRMGGEGGWDLLAVYDPAGRVFVNIESEPGQIARIDPDSMPTEDEVGPVVAKLQEGGIGAKQLSVPVGQFQRSTSH